MDMQIVMAIGGSIIGALVFAVATFAGWTGSRMVSKLDELDHKVDNLTVDVLSRVNRIDNRVSVLEVKVGSLK